MFSSACVSVHSVISQQILQAPITLILHLGDLPTPTPFLPKHSGEAKARVPLYEYITEAVCSCALGVSKQPAQ